mgnify:CR=1 FL=1
MCVYISVYSCSLRATWAFLWNETPLRLHLKEENVTADITLFFLLGQLTHLWPVLLSPMTSTRNSTVWPLTPLSSTSYVGNILAFVILLLIWVHAASVGVPTHAACLGVPTHHREIVSVNGSARECACTCAGVCRYLLISTRRYLWGAWPNWCWRIVTFITYQLHIIFWNQIMMVMFSHIDMKNNFHFGRSINVTWTLNYSGFCRTRLDSDSVTATEMGTEYHHHHYIDRGICNIINYAHYILYRSCLPIC